MPFFACNSYRVTNSPSNYTIEAAYFCVNNKENTKITPVAKPSTIFVASRECIKIVVAIAQMVGKERLLVIFEEEKERRDLPINIPARSLLTLPFLVKK